MGNKLAVKTVGNQIDTDCCDDYPQRIDLFTAVEGDIAQGKGTHDGEPCPYEVFP